jgi:patatin-like phospholipase/acyl hydrolase
MTNQLKKKVINILSIDGGGIRGYLPLKLFNECGYTTEYLNTNFDYIIGTSTGGLIGTGIRSGLSINEMLNIFENNDNFNQIFKKTWSGYLGIVNEKYNGTSFIKFLSKNNYFDNKKMIDINRFLLVTSYDLCKAKPIVFKSYKTTHKDIYLYDVLRSTCAAPTYFKPHLTYYNRIRKCVDGGVWANDPSLIGLIECIIHLSQNQTNDQNNKTYKKITDINDIKINIVSMSTKIIDFLMNVSNNGNDLILKNLSESIGSIDMMRH